MISVFAEVPVLKDDLQRVLMCLRDAVFCKNTRLQASIEGLLAKPGKLVRPGLVVLGARYAYQEQADSEAWKRHLPEATIRLAAAVELLHLASMIHDDVIDQAVLRRNMPSFLALHGAGDAVLIGDLLMASGLRLVADLAEKKEVSQVIEAVQVIIQAEARQSESRMLGKASVKKYLHQIAGKTAVLMCLALRAGAQKNGASEQACQQLQRTAWNMGMAFQIVDDMLDFSNQSSIGKPAQSDLKAGIWTLPVLLALNKYKQSAGNTESVAQQKKLAKELERPSLGRNSRRKIVDLVKNLSGFSQAQDWAKRYTERAKRSLEALKDGHARVVLARLLDHLVARQE